MINIILMFSDIYSVVVESCHTSETEGFYQMLKETDEEDLFLLCLWVQLLLQAATRKFWVLNFCRKCTFSA